MGRSLRCDYVRLLHPLWPSAAPLRSPALLALAADVSAMRRFGLSLPVPIPLRETSDAADSPFSAPPSFFLVVTACEIVMAGTAPRPDDDYDYLFKGVWMLCAIAPPPFLPCAAVF